MSGLSDRTDRSCDTWTPCVADPHFDDPNFDDPNFDDPNFDDPNFDDPHFASGTALASPAAMKYARNVREFREYGMTTLEFSGSEVQLHMRFVSRHSKWERRAMARAFLAQMGPLLRYFASVGLDHTNTAWVRPDRTRRHIMASAGPGDFGFDFRMKRLSFGHTQAVVAAKAGLQRSHLSDIERGISKASATTQARLEIALMELAPKPAEAS